jgi:hypothetical protein
MVEAGAKRAGENEIENLVREQSPRTDQRGRPFRGTHLIESLGPSEAK